MNPRISLLTATYFPPGEAGRIRREGFEESLHSWHTHLKYDGQIIPIIVNDGLLELSAIQGWPERSILLGHLRNGEGACFNQGLQEAWEISPLVLNIVDDMLLTEPLDLTPWAAMLMDDAKIGAVHFAPYPGCTGTIEPRAHGWVVRLNRHNLAAGLRPCLYHKRFFDAYGGFEEGIAAWEMERIFNEHFCQSSGPDSVLALPLPWKEGRGSVVELGNKNPKTFCVQES